MIRLFFALILATVSPVVVTAQSGPLVLDLRGGDVEPLPFALPIFEAESPGAAEIAVQMSEVIAADLVGTGLFRQISSDAFIATPTSFAAPIEFSNWRAINARALISGAVDVVGDQVVVKFRLYDVVTGEEMGAGQQLVGTTSGWRRIAHKVADAVYARVAGEPGYFDSRVVFISESGPKDARRKRVAIMDYDGANLQFLTDSSAIVLAPRFSPDGGRVLYTSFESGLPQINVLDVATVTRQTLPTQSGQMAFSPRFSRDGQSVVYSLITGGNTDIYRMDLGSGAVTQLTNAPSIETAPSFSPDGGEIVFESDRSGTPQLYVMSAFGGEPRRISFGEGRYSTPVWSPSGDYIAFTKQHQGRFHIGVMRTDGSEERLLTGSPLDEGPTWAPNGRMIMFTRETPGAQGTSALYSVDLRGQLLRPVRIDGGGSDPSWGPLQQ